MEFSDMVAAGQAALDAENKEYYDMLGDVDARQKFFGALTNVKSDDHKTIK